MRIQYPKPTAVGQLQILNFNAMKTLAELLELASKAIQQSGREMDTWFINYSGHVQLLEIQYCPVGWDSEKKKTNFDLRVYLNNEDDIQLAYWFIKKHLR